MPKFIFFIAAMLVFGSCERHDANDKGYVFHDDFYYSYPEGGKIYLTPYLNEHYIRFDTRYQTEVLGELLDRGFQLIDDPVVQNYFYGDDFEVPEEIKYGSVVSVRGDGKIADIPHVIYSHHLYQVNGDLFGRSNFLTVFYDIENAGTQVESLMQYAKQHALYPLSNDNYFGQMLFACTNKSSGNPVELANWFVETGGFIMAMPDSGYRSSGNLH